MKTRQSGKPEEEIWAGFFDPELALRKLFPVPKFGDAVEFSCENGKLTIPAARIVSSAVYALDIEPEMFDTTRAKAEAAGFGNVKTCLRGFATDGTSVDYARLFNTVEAKRPEVTLQEAFRVVRDGGILVIMHWNRDASTPRGPSIDIRPRPEQFRGWADDVGSHVPAPGIIDFPPDRYGMTFELPWTGKEGRR